MHDTGTWQFPGGHLDLGETYFACAERETLEETGLVVRAEKLIAVTDDIFDPASKHYVTIFVLCQMVGESREPKVRRCCALRRLFYANAAVVLLQVMEPEKCEFWAWKTWADVRAVAASEDGRQKIFLPIVNLLRDHPDIEALI